MRHDSNHSVGRRAAFTLTELLVAVSILIVVVLAAGKIFGTAGDITRAGQANTDILQTAAAIERQLRQDLANITTDGFLVIDSVSVPNDLHRATNPQAPLIDPSREAIERVRSDRLLFFAQGVTPTQQFVGSSQLISGGQEIRIRDQSAIETRIQYGHGVQLGNRLRPRADAFFFNSDGSPLLPWSWNDPLTGPDLTVQAFPSNGQQLPPAVPTLPAGQQPLVNGTQPAAPRWILARQQVLLADEGRSPFYYRANILNPPGSAQAAWGPPNSTTGIWPNSLGAPTFNRFLASSRVDVAATNLGAIRGDINSFTTVADRRNRMLDALLFPRAEVASQPILISQPLISDANLARLEQMLTAPTLAVGCSEFIVEWTWSDGVGDVRRQTGVLVPGLQLNAAAEQPWFGLADVDRSVFPLGAAPAVWPWNWGTVGPSIFPANIESTLVLPGNVTRYSATFGYNRTTALSPYPIETPQADLGFTPWPTAIRITMTLHDQRGSLEQGRRFQFVVPLPDR